MKTLLLLLLICGCAHHPKPARVTRMLAPPHGAVLSAVKTPQGFRVEWADTNNWLLEFSTNASTWTRVYCETYYQSGIKSTEGFYWADRLFFRLRKQ